MADDGIEFDEFNRDDDDGDYGEAETSFTIDDNSQTILNTQHNLINDLNGESASTQHKIVEKSLIKQFYGVNGEPIPTSIGVRLYMKDDSYGRPMLYAESPDGKNIALSWYRGKNPNAKINFYSVDTLGNKYGVAFVRVDLGLDNYEFPATRVRYEKKLEEKYMKTREEINNAEEQIPSQDFTETSQVRETIYITESVKTDGLDLREIQGLDKALQRMRGELDNNLSKLTEIDKDLAYEKGKLEQAKSDNDEFQIKEISKRIKELEEEKSLRLEAASENKEVLRSQFNRIKETINRVLNKDTNLKEKIKTLFREQGITIVSVLTAFGMIIGVIVEAVIHTTGGGTVTPEPPPKDGSGVKEWIKKQLSNLGKLLAKLAGKAAAALPGIIGSIVSWLLSTAGEVVSWLGNNLIVLVGIVGAGIVTAAIEYINKPKKNKKH